VIAVVRPTRFKNTGQLGFEAFKRSDLKRLVTISRPSCPYRAGCRHPISLASDVSAERASRSGERRGSGEFVHVELAPGVVTILPAWKLDAIYCAGHHQVRKLIKAGILVSEQTYPRHQHIRAADLESERVIAVLKRRGRPCRVDSEKQILEEGVQIESVITDSSEECFSCHGHMRTTIFYARDCIYETQARQGRR
jgi:hypothetical protein